MCLCLFVERAGDTGGGGGGSTGPATADLVSDDDYGQSTDTELLFRCRICWKGFKHPMSLTLHKDLHTGQTRCPICQRIFSRSYDMKAHLLRIHKCTFSVDAKLNFRKWIASRTCRYILSRDTVDRFIGGQAKKRTTFSFFFIRSNFFFFFIAIITCYMYILYRFFFFHRSTVSYPIDFKAVLSVNLCFVLFFFFSFSFYTYYFYTYLSFAFFIFIFFFYIRIYIYS